MTIAVGTKKKTAAITHKLIDDVPLCAAAAIHRGPSTVAMLKSRTSQNPISLRNCAMGLAALLTGWLTRSFSWQALWGARLRHTDLGNADTNRSERARQGRTYVSVEEIRRIADRQCPYHFARRNGCK